MICALTCSLSLSDQSETSQNGAILIFWSKLNVLWVCDWPRQRPEQVPNNLSIFKIWFLNNTCQGKAMLIQIHLVESIEKRAMAVLTSMMMVMDLISIHAKLIFLWFNHTGCQQGPRSISFNQWSTMRLSLGN